MKSSYLYLRHAWQVRVLHWINVLALALLLTSGLNIFNSHAALYWGKSSYSGDPPVLKISARRESDGRWVGVTQVLGAEFRTTGVLGISREANGALAQRAFPHWLTVPDTGWLSMARRWHFFFAWVLVINGALYLAWSLWSRHLSRDLAPTRSDWRSFAQSVRDHLRLRHPQGEAAKPYNVLQKLAYLIVIFGLLPLVILMGLAMSPGMNSIWPGWVDLVGGRQSARTLHFVAAWALVLFALVHVFEVIITGLWNNLRSMITGRFRITREVDDAQVR